MSNDLIIRPDLSVHRRLGDAIANMSRTAEHRNRERIRKLHMDIILEHVVAAARKGKFYVIFTTQKRPTLKIGQYYTTTTGYKRVYVMREVTCSSHKDIGYKFIGRYEDSGETKEYTEDGRFNSSKKADGDIEFLDLIDDITNDFFTKEVCDDLEMFGFQMKKHPDKEKHTIGIFWGDTPLIKKWPYKKHDWGPTIPLEIP